MCGKQTKPSHHQPACKEEFYNEFYKEFYKKSCNFLPPCSRNNWPSTYAQHDKEVILCTLSSYSSNIHSGALGVWKCNLLVLPAPYCRDLSDDLYAKYSFERALLARRRWSTWSTWSAGSNLTPRTGELRSTPSWPDDASASGCGGVSFSPFPHIASQNRLRST